MESVVPKMLKNEKIPSETECLALLEKHICQPTVLAHSKVVAKVAFALAKKLLEKHPELEGEVSAQRVRAAALLHDIAKLEKNLSGEWVPRHDHAREGAKILRKEELREIAEIVGRHVAEPGDETPVTWEDIIVFYADKRVEWDKIVSISERFAALRKRYGHKPGALERLDKVWPFVKKVEAKIWRKIGGRPLGLEKILE